jgi:hypothetical protein
MSASTGVRVSEIQSPCELFFVKGLIGGGVGFYFYFHEEVGAGYYEDEE